MLPALRKTYRVKNKCGNIVKIESIFVVPKDLSASEFIKGVSETDYKKRSFKMKGVTNSFKKHKKK